MSKSYRRSSVSVSIDVSIDDFDDATLIAEVIERDLALAVSAEHNGAAVKQQRPLSAICADAQSWLISGRNDRAVALIREAIAALVPPDLIDALDDAQAGRTSAAICALDHIIQPSPAVTATTIPIELQRLKAEAHP